VALIAIATSEVVCADGPFALVSGRRDPSAIVIDLGKALEPANDGTSNAIISRPRITPDIDTNGDGVADAPAAGLPSNIVLSVDRGLVFVANHAGNATAAEVSVFQHGHPGTVTVLDLEAVLDPANDGTTSAIAAVIPSGGFGPVGLAPTEDGRFVLVGNSESDGDEDGGREIGILDIERGELVGVLRLPLGDGGAVAQAPGYACEDLEQNPARLPHTHPDGNVGCFPDINGITIAGGYAFAANAGTDDVSVIDIQRALDGSADAQIARIPVDRGPWGLAFSPNGALLAVTNRESAELGTDGNSVSIIDVAAAIGGATNAEVARVTLNTATAAEPTRPFGVSFTLDGTRILVANFRSNDVAIIDVGRALEGATDAELARIALTAPGGSPARPRGIAMTPDGRFAAVSGGAPDAAGGGSLWLIDLATTEVAATVTGVGNEPYLLAIAPEDE
jgi:YVTN family beta-propeller protein